VTGTAIRNRIAIVTSNPSKAHSKAKRRAPAYSRALRQIRCVVQLSVGGNWSRANHSKLRGEREGEKGWRVKEKYKTTKLMVSL